MKKKILSVMLALSMLGLAACGATTTTNETNSVTTEENVEVSTAVMEDENKNPNQVDKDEAFANVYTEPETTITTETTTEVETVAEPVTETATEEEKTEVTTEEAYVAPDNYFNIMAMPMEDFLKYFETIESNVFTEIEVEYPRIELYFDNDEPYEMNSAVYCEFKDDEGNVKDVVRVVEYTDGDAAFKYFISYREYASNVFEKSQVNYRNSDGLSWYICASHPDVRPGMTEATFLSNNRVVYYYTMKPYDAETIKSRIHELFKLEVNLTR